MATKVNMLLKFRDTDSEFGVTRETLQAIAKKLDMSKTAVVHLALARFAEHVLPAYEPDDGPLTGKYVKALRKEAAKHLPTGEVLFEENLFP